MRQLIFMTASLTTLIAGASPDEDYKRLKIFPPAEVGMVRYAIMLPHKEPREEVDYRVELIAGKQVLTDGINHVWLMGGKIEAVPIKGGDTYKGEGTYYKVASFGSTATTLIGTPSEVPPIKKFLRLPSKLVHYNSSIPLVVYVPKGGEVRYRIWKAPEITKKAKEK